MKDHFPYSTSLIGWVLVEGGSIFVSLILFWCLVATVIYVLCALECLFGALLIYFVHLPIKKMLKNLQDI